MDAKNWEAMESGREWMLWKFASLPIEKGAIEKFLETYGELYPGLTVRECQIFVKIIQSAWSAETDEDDARISEDITAIFERDTSERFQGTWGGLPGATSPHDDPWSRPAVTADFATGEVTIKPRTLLDWLAKSLLECRHKLAICERKGCEHPYFVKTHPRYRYCSPSCGYAMRKKGKRRWWREKRGKDNRLVKASKRRR